MDAYFADFPLMLVSDEQRGRFVIATRDIQPGEIVLLARAWSVSISDSFKKRTCGFCCRFQAGRLPVKCHCARVFYCSSACREAHVPSHSALCLLFGSFATSKFDHDTTTLMQLLLEVFVRKQKQIEDSPIDLPIVFVEPECCCPAEAGSVPDEDASEKEIHTSATAIVEQAQTNEPLNEDAVRTLDPGFASTYTPTYRDFELLCSHEEEWGEEEQSNWAKPLQHLLKALHDYGAAPPSKDDLLRTLSRIESNSFAMYGVNHGKPTIIGRAVLPAASYFNHSCEPNVSVDINTRVLASFRATKLVRKDEELCVSYIDWNLPRSTRQHELITQYYFRCACSRCQAEAAGGASHVTYERSHSKMQGRRNHHRSTRPLKR